ncbi:class I SAM-dependent methyltransferase [Parabacteroides goldsteinii]|uniref:class I SAM-dependent methyltransferase n=1 Tax=Parabacteroides goldsteinii TaxID=328812 RepID=UPI00241F91BF|nr:class I SAM-dependent methyltransferase [Parabacteroides goldsteinii]
MNKYYPNNYYSYTTELKLKSLKSKIAHSLLKRVIAVRLGHIDFIGVLALVYNRYYHDVYPYLDKSICDFDSTILDIGCGNGFFLNYLNGLGFTNLTGIDPFLESDIYYPNGVKVLRKSISELEGTYKVIMLHHSFEHMSEPLDVFCYLNRLLETDGTLIIRIPLTDGYAWRKYGMHWYQVDAPRHFFLHTQKSISILAKSSNLKVVKVEFDSTGAQIINSEKYLNNIAFIDDFSISDEKCKAANNKANELNLLMDGDQACFYLKK